MHKHGPPQPGWGHPKMGVKSDGSATAHHDCHDTAQSTNTGNSPPIQGRVPGQSALLRSIRKIFGHIQGQIVLFCIANRFAIKALEEIPNWFPACIFGTVPLPFCEKLKLAVLSAVVQNCVYIPLVGSGIRVRYGSLMEVQWFGLSVVNIRHIWLMKEVCARMVRSSVIRSSYEFSPTRCKTVAGPSHRESSLSPDPSGLRYQIV